ncbi:type IV secretion system protein [Chromobacterium amazonense]|uniref:type IV secretion system protein n=1 Tax=Chromobacterium amazonense TaxID=1382803 RepID=UPI001CB89E7F|nr:type IV secretion system protein [Chromobacterium amazonense]
MANTVPDFSIDSILGAADGMTLSFLAKTYPALASSVSTPIYLVAVLYWAVFGIKVYAGHAGLQWKDFLGKTVLTVAAFAVLSWSGLAQIVYGMFANFMESAAATILAGKSTDSMINALWSGMNHVANILMSKDVFKLAMVIQGLVLFILNCVMFTLAVGYMTYAKIGLCITMLLLPLFVGFFFFEQTRQWGMNWINKMMNFAFIYILSIAIIRFGFALFGKAIDDAGKIVDVVAEQGVAAGAMQGVLVSNQLAYFYLVEGVLIFFLLGVRSWAAALTSSASSGTGTLVMMARMAISKGTAK